MIVQSILATNQYGDVSLYYSGPTLMAKSDTFTCTVNALKHVDDVLAARVKRYCEEQNIKVVQAI